MKKYFFLMGIVLILFLIGCQQAPVEEGPTEVPTTTEKPVVTEEQEVVEVPVGEEDIRILGKEGFEPTEITVKVGDVLSITNNDVGNLPLVIVFKKGQLMMNSGLIEMEETYEKSFDEAGTYEYWTTAYGTKGTIVVE